MVDLAAVFMLGLCHSEAHGMCPGFELQQFYRKGETPRWLVCTCDCGHQAATLALSAGTLTPPVGVDADELIAAIGQPSPPARSTEREQRIEEGLDSLARALVKPLSSIADRHHLEGVPLTKPRTPGNRKGRSESNGDQPPTDQPGTRCKGCGALIVWARSEAGVRMPLDPYEDLGWVVTGTGDDGTPIVRRAVVYSPHVCQTASQLRRPA